MARPAPPLPRLLFAFVAPFRDFLRTQSASGLLLVLATAAALAYASVAYWYQDEPHAPFAPLPPASARRPSPPWRNLAQWSLCLAALGALLGALVATLLGAGLL